MKFITRNMRALALATIALAGIASAAFALNFPSSAVFTARQNTTQQTNYYRFTLNFNDANVSSGIKFGRLPASAFVSSIKCHVGTVFNAATTNVVTLGSTATGSQFFGSGDLNEASATFQNLTSAAGLGIAATSAGETDLFARYTQTGAAATTGNVTCAIEYVPNNDM